MQVLMGETCCKYYHELLGDVTFFGKCKHFKEGGQVLLQSLYLSISSTRTGSQEN